MRRAVPITTAATALLACGGGETTEGWQVLHASIADGYRLTNVYRAGPEIWAVGIDERPEDFPTTTIHFDGDEWSPADIELPRSVVITARDSFWKVATDDSGLPPSMLWHSSDGVTWTVSDVASDTGMSIDEVRTVFGSEGVLWIFVYVGSEVALLRHEGDRWIEHSPPRLAASLDSLAWCQRADDDVWFVGKTDIDDVIEIWATRWNGSSWEDFELPPSTESPLDMFCLADDVWLRTSDFEAGGHHLYHRVGGDWIDVRFPDDAFRGFQPPAEDGTPGGLWLVGDTSDDPTGSVGTVTPHIWRVADDEAQETLHGDLGVEALEPHADTRLSGLWSVVRSAEGRAFRPR